MALSELQLETMDADELYKKLQHTANLLNKTINIVKDIEEFIGLITPANLNTLSVPDTSIRTDMADFRTALGEFVTYCGGGSVTPTVTLEDTIDKHRSM